jgi:hypothetical protein
MRRTFFLYAVLGYTDEKTAQEAENQSKLTLKIGADLLRGVNVSWTVEIGCIGRQQGDHTQKLKNGVKEWSKSD